MWALALAAIAGVGAGVIAATAAPTPSVPVVATATPSPSMTDVPTATPTDTPAPSPSPTEAPSTPTPTATPSPAPALVPAPLTGRLVTPDVARRHAIAVMIDDHPDARPQSGFNDASVVWQAPAEGGIPRYMMVFQDRVPPSVGPVRSARQYYLAWAAEWDAVYAHVGGSPAGPADVARTGSRAARLQRR